MNWQQAALSVIVGALIGYTTNWIAIRMLFRPLQEKKAFGMHIPFTPGVIPRGKGRLAEGMGEMVGGMLLTGESVVQHLLQPATEKRVQCFLAGKLEEIKSRDLTLGQALEALGDGSGALEDLDRQFAAIVANLARSRGFQRTAAGFAADLVDSEADRRIASTIGVNGPAEFRPWLEALLSRLLHGETGRNLERQLAIKIEQLLNSQEKIRDYLPEAVREGIHRFVDDQAPRIFQALEQYLSSPGARKAMKNRIDHFFEGTALKKMLNGVFQLLGGDSDFLTQRLAAEIAQFFADEQARAEIVERLHILVEEALDKSLSEITSSLDAPGKREKASEIAAWLAEKLRQPGFGAVLLDRIEDLLDRGLEKTWRQVLDPDGRSSREKIAIFLEGVLGRMIVRLEADGELDAAVRRGISRLWQVKLSALSTLLPSGKDGDLVETATGAYRFLVRKTVPGLTGFLDVSGMVRNRVEGLDVLEVEHMLLGIIRRELVAITWLGALLGAVLGLVMVGLQYIMK